MTVKRKRRRTRTRTKTQQHTLIKMLNEWNANIRVNSIFHRNQPRIEYHRCVGIVCYNHFNFGCIYIILSTNEEASEASRCHTSGKLI